jgi:DNA-directed RNA polymerase
MQNQDELYILKSKQNIDFCIYNNDYKRAFGLLVMVLERLDEDQKKDIIEYYSIYLQHMGLYTGIRYRTSII